MINKFHNNLSFVHKYTIFKNKSKTFNCYNFLGHPVFLTFLCLSAKHNLNFNSRRETWTHSVTSIVLISFITLMFIDNSSQCICDKYYIQFYITLMSQSSHKHQCARCDKYCVVLSHVIACMSNMSHKNKISEPWHSQPTAMSSTNKDVTKPTN